jgi:ATP-dependent Clp endopeptidase proteolytic subunit ClpP
MNGKFKVSRPIVNLKQGKRDWFSIKNSGDSSTEVFIYDEIGYWGITAQDFVNELKAADTKNITLRLNSPGGEIFDGIAIYNALMDHPATITSIVDGVAASAASFIFMAGDTRIMNRSSTAMIHDGIGLAVGNASDMREMADQLDQASDNIASIYSERAGGSVSSWREKMKAETWYTADEAVKAGLAHKVNGQDAQENLFDLSIFNYAGRNKAPEPVIDQVKTNFADLFKSAIREAVA